MTSETQSSSSLCREFIQTAKAALSKTPEVKHSWSIDPNEVQCSLSIPKIDEDGFDVTIEVSPDGVVVFGEGAHQHFDTPESTHPEKIIAALGLVRDLLSPHMRVGELRAGKSAFRWFMESLHENEWQAESSTGLLFWNYFARRSERVLQNKTLPGRLSPK
ncbi:MAG: hypothetical protein HY301_00435 [Verrucomicrobia bacterium]|nr:hypothetical protein [Verrucomicrobiota bacterium]